MIRSPLSLTLTTLKLYAALTLLALLAACQSTYPPLAAPGQSPGTGEFRVVTLNTGSGKAIKVAAGDNAGFGPEQAALAN